MKKICFEELMARYQVEAFYTPKEMGTWTYGNDDAPKLFAELAQDLGITTERIVRTIQTHTSAVKLVDAANGGEGAVREFGISGFDGMVTKEKNLLLCTLEADCVPVFLIDTKLGVIANVHSGWRGTVGQISANALKLMAEKFGSEPENIVAGIGPCICEKCYEVSDDLLAPFKEVYAQNEVEQLFQPKANGKYLLNLKKAIKLTLLKAGVAEDNIYDCGRCTYHEGVFDSYRLNGGKTWRMLSGIMLK